MRPDEIERQSFAIIDTEAGAHGFTPEQWTIVRRMIHTSADFDYVHSVRIHPEAVAAGVRVIRAGGVIYTDSNMARTGIRKRDLAHHNVEVKCLMADDGIARLAGEHGITRARAAVDAVAYSSIGQLLGFHQTAWHPNEDEVAEMILWVSRQPLPASAAFDLPEDLAQQVSSGDLIGTPNRLSPKAVAWPIIGQAAAAVEKGTTREVYPSVAQEPPESDAGTSPRAADVIRRRRSAVQFNPQRSIAARTLFDILGRTIAGRDTPPFNAAPPPEPVESLVFVHQVDGLEQGIYLLKRSAQALENLCSAWTEPFLWEPVPCPLPLWRLKSGDVTDLAATLSCQQDIAGQSAFAVAMIAPFEHVVRPAPYRYRHLHWECGMIGQVLYLAAEAHGLRGTGIGCFFDDAVHRLLGIRDTSYQTLYHFTVGHPIEDDRISTLPAYHHLESSDR